MRCAVETREITGAASDRVVVVAGLKFGKGNNFITPSTDSSTVRPPASCARTLKGTRAHEKAFDVNDFEATMQGDATVITRLTMSSALSVLTRAPSRVLSVIVVGVGFEATK